MSESIQYRPFQEGDEEQIVKLLTTCFKDWPGIDLEQSPLDHWYWKYNENKVLSQIISVALEGEHIVGVNHSYLKKMKIFDSPKLCRYAADTAVHPEYRRRGIYNKLIELSNIYAGKPGTDIVYYVSSNPVLVEKWSKTRQSFPYNVLNLVWIDDVDKQLDAMPMKYPYLVKTGVKGLQAFKKLRETLSKEPETRHCNINEVTSFDQRIDRFWKKIDHHYRFITIRNRDNLNWRFCDPRAGRYHILQAEDDGEIQGYISLFVNRLNKKYPIGFIADLLTLPEKKAVSESLIMNALEFFKENQVNIINCQVVQGHSNENALKKLGFLDTRIRLHLFYRNYKHPDPVKKLSDATPNMMHFNYSDIDSMPTNPPEAR